MNGAAKMWIKGGTKGFLLDRLWKAYTDPPTPVYLQICPPDQKLA